DAITAGKQNMNPHAAQEGLLTANTPMWPESHQLELREALSRSQGATSGRRFQERSRSVSGTFPSACGRQRKADTLVFLAETLRPSSSSAETFRPSSSSAETFRPSSSSAETLRPSSSSAETFRPSSSSLRPSDPRLPQLRPSDPRLPQLRPSDPRLPR
ncbi:hypothetical protein KUCAC02_026762, partial [Chaenocephalus aceratus]